ncbi:MAG: D-2-hydroxyacid dehydrogenase [Anaerolineae bacterium]|nr:D-2-hydroxyacid dehydrogenase [Anaerolineae bacterium]
MEPLTVLSLIQLTEDHRKMLQSLPLPITVHVLPDVPFEDLPAEVRAQAGVLFGNGALLPQAPKFPRLQWVQTASAGVDRLIGTPLWDTDIAITTASGIHATPIAERALAMMLAFRAQLPRLWDFKQRKEWPEARWGMFDNPGLRGATLGIVGYGAIGGELARQADALGMRVLAMNRSGQRRSMTGYLEPGVGDREIRLPEKMYATSDLPEMLAECDHVVMLTPLTAETHQMINAAAIAAMKSSAYFYNFGRGGLVDETALIAALRSGSVAGAGLDVFAQEPLPPESPLWDMSNVIISPHVGGMSAHYDVRAASVLIENMKRFVNQQPLLNLVDRQFGY